MTLFLLSLQTIHRRFQSTQQGRKFFNFVKTNKQQPLQQPQAPLYDAESIFSPKLQLPTETPQTNNVFNKKPKQQTQDNQQTSEPQQKEITPKYQT